MDMDELLEMVKSPKVYLPAIGVLVIVVVVLVFVLGSSPEPAAPAASAGAEQEPLTEEQIQERDSKFQYKFQIAEGLLKKGKHQEALDRLKEAEEFKKTLESRKLAKEIADKMEEQKDHDAFKKALNAEEPIPALEDYLKKFPSALHLKETEEKLVVLREEERKREAKYQKILDAAAKLRSQYKEELDVEEVKSLIKKYNFPEKYYNKNGDFKNHYELKKIKKDEVVSDYSTGLMWHQSGSSRYFNFETAKQWLADLNETGYAGYNDWRLPTLEEAISLMENKENRAALFIDDIFHQEQQYIWTGDKFSEGKAWAVDYYGGDVNKVDSAYTAYVRPVRSLR